MPTPIKSERDMALYQTIASLRDAEECVHFFEDLLAVTELSAIEQRFQVAVCLLDRQPYSEILARTGASSATVSRVNRMLREGTGVLAAAAAGQTEKMHGAE